MVDSNIHQWLEKIFTDEEALQLIEIYNSQTGSNINIALLPFVSYEAMYHALREAVALARSNTGQFHDPREIEAIEKLLSKLDEDQYWVDMSKIGDNWRIEYNTVTEQRRELDWHRGFEDDFKLFGNVRSTL